MWFKLASNSLGKRRLNFNRAVRALLLHVVRTVPEFSHVRPAQVLVVAGEARRASRATVKPLCFEGQRLDDGQGRRKPLVKIRGRRMLYCVTLRPLFFRRSTPQARIATLLHELFHVSPAFDGTLSLARRHHLAGEAFSRTLLPLVRAYVEQCPRALWEAVCYDGEVKVWQWLEKPVAWYHPDRERVRAVYTEEQLFLGSVRMMTRSAPRRSPARRVKVH